MDLLTSLWGFVWGGLSYIVPFIIVLGVVVFVHEMGHFLVGRWCGARIEAFSIGFGRAIASWVDRHGTVWKLSWLPLGGYVKFWGDEDATSLPNDERLKRIANDPAAASCFHFKPLWQKAAITAAGPAVNFLFAIIVFAAIFMFVGVGRVTPMVGPLKTDSAAYEAGVREGDTIVAIDGQPIDDFGDLARAAILSDGNRITLTVDRIDQRFDFVTQPKRVERTDQFGNKYTVYQFGIPPSKDAAIRWDQLSPVQAIGEAVGQVYFFVEHTFVFIGGLIAGREDARQLSGPLGIAKTSGEIATLGVLALIQLMAILSVSVGLINLFPIPMLDGGHLFFYAIEAVRRRPLGVRAQEYGLRIGLALVLSLMLFATWNDLMRIFWS